MGQAGWWSRWRSLSAGGRLAEARLPEARLANDGQPAGVTLVPLFHAALLLMAGIVLGHVLYLRPGYLLAALAGLAVLAAVAIWRAPRVAWLPLALLWVGVGAWAVETEPMPVANPAVTRLAAGLMRTVEGRVVAAGALHGQPMQQESDADLDETAAGGGGRLTQRVDLELTQAEVVTDSEDAMEPLSAGSLPSSFGQSPIGQPPTVRLTVAWPGNPPALVRCGDRIRVVVRLQPPDTYHDPGVWDRRTWLVAQGISATGSVAAAKTTPGGATSGDAQLGAAASSDAPASRFALLGHESQLSAGCLVAGWQQRATERIESLPRLTRVLPAPLRITSDDAAMVAAMVAGDRGYLSGDLRRGFERTGSFHLIVVSGLHLAILAGCVFWAARRLRLGRLPATLVTLAVAASFALFTGFAIPVERALWMIALYLIGRLLYRDRNPLNVIGFATICLLAADPRALFEASLEMTLLSVAAIAGVALPLLEATTRPVRNGMRDLRVDALDARCGWRVASLRLWLRLVCEEAEAAFGARLAWRGLPWLVCALARAVELVVVGVVVELALALPMAVYFHRITVYALPVNLATLPLLGLLVPAALVTVALLLVWPALAVAPAAVTAALLHLSLWLVHWPSLAALSDLRVPEPAPWQVVVASLLLVAALLLARVTAPTRSAARSAARSELRLRALALAAVVAMAAVALAPRPVERPAGRMMMQAIDVGQGDALLLVSPEGRTLLIDGGGIPHFGETGTGGTASTASSSSFDLGEDVVSATLWQRGIRRLDAVALTHGHADHLQGLMAVVRNFQPALLWVGNNPMTPEYRALLDEARETGTRIESLRAGDQRQLGSVALLALAPAADYLPGASPTNNDSLVLRASWRGASVLLPGDAEAGEERAVIAAAARLAVPLASTVLKVGHHGSVTSTRPEFLTAVAPSWAVISCGRRNHFGHPREEVLLALEAAHVATLRTDTGGTVCLVMDGQTVAAQPMCDPALPPLSAPRR